MIKRIFSVLILPAVLVACTQQKTDVPKSIQPTQTNITSIADNSSDRLTNYCNFPSTPPSAGSDQSAFDTYSWQMFMALNWVNSITERGQADCSQPMTASGFRVWQSWKTTEQVFLPGAANPGSWNSGWGTGETLKLTAKSKVSHQAASDASSEQSSVLQPVGGWLIDQRGNPTYYQIASNEISYNYIVNNDLYNANTVQSFSDVNFPWQSVEIKASWRILEPQDDATRYLTVSAQVEQFDSQGNPLGTFVQANLGLVGLHIINKAPGFPQWIWATFEQVDNVDPSATFAPYYNSSAQNPNQSPCYNNAFPCLPEPGSTFSTPDPLTRLTAIDSSTEQVNSTFQAMYPSDFPEYYQLVTTQRPTNPNDPGDPLGTPNPNVSANVTMESYIQQTSSCMACHQIASGIGTLYRSDFSFLLLHAQLPSTALLPESSGRIQALVKAEVQGTKQAGIDHQMMADQ